MKSKIENIKPELKTARVQSRLQSLLYAGAGLATVLAVVATARPKIPAGFSE